MKNEAYSTTVEALADLKDMVGKEVGLSDWVTITQDDINKFGSVTGDEQWIHMDEEKSKAHSPYGTTIAHGFFVLSLLSKLSYEVMQIKDVKMGVNYGLNKLRFTNATKSGARIRGRVTIKDYEEIANGAKYIMHWVVEIEGEEKPALIADWIGVAYN